VSVRLGFTSAEVAAGAVCKSRECIGRRAALSLFVLHLRLAGFTLLGAAAEKHEFSTQCTRCRRAAREEY
jgi:hypothetical protein